MHPRKAPSLHRRILFGIPSALGALALDAGCSGKPLPPPPHPPPPAPVTAASDAPARWVYHPTDHYLKPLAVRSLEEGGCLFTAEHGQRWVTTPAAAAGQSDSAASPTHAAAPFMESCGKKAHAATEPAPEELIAIVRQGEHAFRFIGQSGALYEANEPLAPLRRVTAAPNQPFVKASGEGDVVLGVTRDGKLFRFTGRDGYHQAALRPPDGRLFDVAMSSWGRALALSAPEALFTSGDGGVTWKRAPVPTIGVQRVRRTLSGSLLAEGTLGSYEWRDNVPLTAAPTRLLGHLPSREVERTLDVPPVPASNAVKYGVYRDDGGAAVLDDDRYAQVREPEDKEGAWRLLRGKLDGHLEVTPLPQSKRCGVVSLGGRGEYLFTSCISDDRKAVEVRRSADFGETWSAPLTLTGSTSPVTIGVSPHGDALITGVCMPTATNGRKCKPTTPLRVKADEATLQATATVAPELNAEAAYRPAYAFDGRSAYFLAGNVATPDIDQEHPDELKLFVSHDEGKTFSARPLEVVMPRLICLPDRFSTYFIVSHYGIHPAGLSPGADGTLGLWVDTIASNPYQFYKGALRTPQCAGKYLTMDADGRGLHQVSPPADDAMIGGFGGRLIAFADTRKDGRFMTRLWESGDGGSTWEPKRLPDTLANGLIKLGTLDESIACAAGGCLVGDILTRVGWGGPSAPAHPDPAPGARDNPSSSALTPIVCELSQDTPWKSTAPQVIPRKDRGDSQVRLPDARVAMRGRSVWSSLTTTPESDAVSVLSAMLPASGEGEARIAVRPLLGSALARSPRMRVATQREDVREGYVALRASWPVAPDGHVLAGATRRDVEVVWENYLEGTSGHSRVPNAVMRRFTTSSAGMFSDDDVVSDISMKVDGVAVKPAWEGEGWLPGFTLDAKGHTAYAPYPSSHILSPVTSGDGEQSLIYLQSDLVRAGGKLLGARLMRQDPEDLDHPWSVSRVDGPTTGAIVVLLGRPTGAEASAPRQGLDPWAWSTFTLTPPGGRLADPYASDASWTYAGKTTRGLISFVVEKRKGRAYASFYALRDDGTFAPPVPVATRSDLGDRPRACTVVERATSARLVSAMQWDVYPSEDLFPGLQHSVLVREAKGQGAATGSEPVVLRTGATVTHGTPDSACIAAWEAKSPTDKKVSAILSGDLTHSWMFRLGQQQTDSRGHSGEALEYRPMRCHFEPSAPVAEPAGK